MEVTARPDRFVASVERTATIRLVVGKDVGMAVFGVHGFIIGPTIAAMFIAVWHLSISAIVPEQ